MIDLRHLEALITISKCDSLSKAARQLYITQPALSRSMQKLENELNVSLFNHGTNKVTLNRIGETAVAFSQKILEQVEEMKEELHNLNRLLTTILIGSCAPAPTWGLIPLLSKKFPDMSISFEIQVDTDILIQSLKKGEYKIIITASPLVADDILTLPYISEQLYLAVPKDHKLANSKGIYIENIRNQTFVQYAHSGLWVQYFESEMKSCNFIYMDKYEDFLELVKTTTLPYFLSNLSSSYYPHPKDRIHIPVLDEFASQTYYCSCMKENAKYLPESNC